MNPPPAPIAPPVPPHEDIPGYEAWRQQFIHERLVVLYIVGLIANPAFSILDWLAHPYALRELTSIRIVLETGLLAGFMLVRYQIKRIPAPALLTFWILFPNVLVVHMTVLTGGFAAQYYNGLSLVWLAAGVIVPMSWRAHLTAQIGTLVYYYAVNWWAASGAVDRAAMIQHPFFLVWYCVAIIIAVTLYERLQRAEFEARMAERRAREELEASHHKLLELDKLKDEFFANISHELRTPLAVSLGAFKEALQSPLPASVEAVLESGLRNTSRLLFLINELLELSKFESGHTGLKKVCIDVHALIKNVAANFQSSDRQRVFIEGPSEPVLVEVDVRRIVTVVYNLLANALKFSDPDSGQVWIRIRAEDGQVVVEIEDNGIGIAEDQLGRIFDRFYQVEGHVTRRYEGSGIGLALAKEIVALHQGTIAVRSTPGRGSTFTVTLPRGEVQSAEAVAIGSEDLAQVPIGASHDGPEQLHSAAAGDHEGRPLIMIVDDNADMRAYLARLLSDHYRVMVASNGAQALEQVRSEMPALVLADMMMPVMSGSDLLRELRSTDDLRTIPFIMLTARAGTDARVETFEAGADDYVSKPFSEEELLARISNQIRIHRQERELEAQTAQLRQLASELERANTDLRELSNKKSEFVAIVSHDLRTPLTAMIGLLDNLLEGIAGTLNEKQAHYVTRIRSNSWRLIRMVNDLLDIAKIESGKISFEPHALDLNAFVGTLVEGLQSVTRDKGIRLETDLDGALWSNVDTDKLHQVLTNLIDNACKFTNAGGEVRVALKPDGGFAQICVADTGCGICADDLPHVFDKFYRGQGQHRARGAGLGLAIVKHFVELHGGRIWVESTLQEGSRFYVAIPRVERTDP